MKRIHYKNLQIGDRHGHWTELMLMATIAKTIVGGRHITTTDEYQKSSKA